MPLPDHGLPSLWCRRCQQTYRQRDMSVNIGGGQRAFLPCPTCRGDLWYLYPSTASEPKRRDPLSWLDGAVTWEP